MRDLSPQELQHVYGGRVQGTGGYDGHPGNQSSSHGNPSGSANPERSAVPEKRR